MCVVCVFVCTLCVYGQSELSVMTGWRLVSGVGVQCVCLCVHCVCMGNQ